MQSAREAGGDCCKYYSDQPNDTAQSRLTLETSLRNALKQEEFILHYQPRVKADNGQVLGAEALVQSLTKNSHIS
jgi:predicted signal transduction protein with EAL and GGDEF domain